MKLWQHCSPCASQDEERIVLEVERKSLAPGQLDALKAELEAKAAEASIAAMAEKANVIMGNSSSSLITFSPSVLTLPPVTLPSGPRIVISSALDSLVWPDQTR
jgi:hypothetical protein